MEFGLSGDQCLLQDAVSRFLAAEARLEVVQRAVEGEDELLMAVRTGLRELGLNALLIPEGEGGLGLGLFEAALVQQMLGRFVAPVDMGGNVLAALAFRRIRDAAARSAWFRKLAAGDVAFGLALSASRAARREASGVQSRGEALHGSVPFAQLPAGATHLLVVDEAECTWIADVASEGFSMTSLETIDRTRSFAALRFEGVVAERIVTEPGAGDLSSELYAAIRILAAADTLGAAERMIEAAVEYSLERKQFGVPIASFQAVKHMCADMAARVEPCKALLWHAAFVVANGMSEGPAMACLAKSHLSDVGRFVARTATEIHGGIGFTDALGLHLWFKRIGVNRQLFGGPEFLRAEAARMQGWTA